jgi:DNA-binding SARP family transcriptional activator
MASPRVPGEAHVRVYTLGRFVVEVGGAPLRFRGRARRRPLELLKTLVALGGESVSAESVAEALWPDSDGNRARQALATNVTRLRELIGRQAVRLQDARITLDPAHCWVDAAAFAEVLEEVARALEQGQGAPVWSAMQEALALYHGPFLEGELDLAPVLTLRERLHGALLRCLRDVAERCRWPSPGPNCALRRPTRASNSWRGVKVSEFEARRI